MVELVGCGCKVSVGEVWQGEAELGTKVEAGVLVVGLVEDSPMDEQMVLKAAGTFVVVVILWV